MEVHKWLRQQPKYFCAAGFDIPGGGHVEK
jgi:hypothetical protein